MTQSAFPAWRWRISCNPIPPRENLSLGVTLAYQHASLGAWRGVFVSLFVATIAIGWTYATA